MHVLEKTTQIKNARSKFRHDYRRFYTYTIYDKATDHPEKVVIRQWELITGAQPAPGLGFVCDNVYEAREMLPPSLYNVGRSENDDPSILETWI